MSYAKLSTARTFLVGPILDTDGAAKTDEVVASIKVTKNGADDTRDPQSTLTHSHTGHYLYVADVDDFDELGEVVFSLNSGTNAMAPKTFQVLPATTYDAIVTNAAGAANGIPIVGSAMGLTAGSIITASFGACVPPAPANMSTLTQTQVSGGAYNLTNATYVAAFKSALGTVPASGNWNTTTPPTALANADAAWGHATVDTMFELLNDIPTNTELASAFTEIKGATFAATDTLEAIRNQGDSAWVTAAGFSTLDAAGVRTAVGMAEGNLDTQLAAITAQIVEGIPIDRASDSVTLTTGTLISGTVANTHTNDGSYYVTAPVDPAVGGFGLNEVFEFNLANAETANEVHLWTHFVNSGSSKTRVVRAMAYDWVNAVDEYISGGAGLEADIPDSSVDVERLYPLLVRHRSMEGIVRIRFVSTSTDTGDRFYLDHLCLHVYAFGPTKQEIAQQVRAELTTELGRIDAIKIKTDQYPVLVTPLAGTVSAGGVSENKILAYQNHALGPYVWTLRDNENIPVNLSGKTVKFHVGKVGSESIPLWSYSSTGANIVISSTNYNVVTLVADDANTGAAGLYQYRLVNHTDDKVLNTGTLKIVSGIAST